MNKTKQLDNMFDTMTPSLKHRIGYKGLAELYWGFSKILKSERETLPKMKDLFGGRRWPNLNKKERKEWSIHMAKGHQAVRRSGFYLFS